MLWKMRFCCSILSMFQWQRENCGKSCSHLPRRREMLWRNSAERSINHKRWKKSEGRSESSIRAQGNLTGILNTSYFRGGKRLSWGKQWNQERNREYHVSHNANYNYKKENKTADEDWYANCESARGEQSESGNWNYASTSEWKRVEVFRCSWIWFLRREIRLWNEKWKQPKLLVAGISCQNNPPFSWDSQPIFHFLSLQWTPSPPLQQQNFN